MPIPAALPPLDPGFEMLVSSQGMSQGLPQTEGVQFFPRAYLRSGNAQFGVQWRNLDSPVATGVAAVYAKYGRTIGKAQVDATIRYRFRTADRTSHPTAWEFSASGRRNFGQLTIQGNADLSFNEFGKGRSLYAEVGPAVTARGFRLSGVVGRRIRETDPDYTSFNLGVSRTVSPELTIDARYHATSRGDLGGRYKPRFVLSARLVL